MNIAEAQAFRVLKARVEALEHEIANLKQIVTILTSPKDSETLRIKKSG
jgi:cell division protein FtsB